MSGEGGVGSEDLGGHKYIVYVKYITRLINYTLGKGFVHVAMALAIIMLLLA